MTELHDIDGRLREVEIFQARADERAVHLTAAVSENNKRLAIMDTKLDRLLSHNGQSANPWVDRGKLGGGAAIVVTVLGLLAKEIFDRV